LMMWGLFKKVVIADRLAIFVSQVYDKPAGYEGPALICATVFFAFQIYCDFSGYSDIAIGAAQVMGFKLMDNFNRPYFSKSIEEFWKRWHISLSTWFKDYLYIPLGGNRVSIPRWYFNIFLTFLISGLWHGADWKYIIWGGLNGFYLIVGIMTRDIRDATTRLLRIDRHLHLHKLTTVLITFTLICITWIFFRAKSTDDALYIFTNLFSGCGRYVQEIIASGSVSGMIKNLVGPLTAGLPRREFFIAIVMILVMETVHLVQRHGHIRQMLRGRPLWMRWSIYYVLIISILFFGMFHNPRQFIYFQF